MQDTQQSPQQLTIPLVLDATSLYNFRKLLSKYISPIEGSLTITLNLTVDGTINSVGGYKANGTSGITGSVTIPQVTPSGSQGSITFTKGLVTSSTNPT